MHTKIIQVLVCQYHSIINHYQIEMCFMMECYYQQCTCMLPATHALHLQRFPESVEVHSTITLVYRLKPPRKTNQLNKQLIKNVNNKRNCLLASLRAIGTCSMPWATTITTTMTNDQRVTHTTYLLLTA